MNHDIKFIYFDVGGVAILDFSKTNKWHEMTQTLGVDESNRKRFDDIFNEFEPEICVGKKSLDEFVKVVKTELGMILPADYSMLKDFVDRFEANVSLHPILNKLSECYQLGLLTNMYPDMLDRIKERSILPQIEWNAVIDSSIEGVMKPQEEIYKLAEDKSGFKGGKILFVENSAMHVEAAKKRGWQTVLYDPSDISGSNMRLKKLLGIKRKN
jgi:FMN phosphatase YigB (HAD superfamily)